MREFGMAQILRVSILTILLMSSIGLSPTRGQTSPRVYEPFVTTPEFQEVYRSAERDYRGTAARFEGLADRNPGTTLGATSLFFAIHFANQDDHLRRLHQRILAEYPNSRFEIDAKGSLLSMQYGDHQAFVAAADQLAQSYGAPPLAQIQSGGDRRSLTHKIWSLPIETQWGLFNLYREVHAALALQLKRYDEALPLAVFRRDTFYTLHASPDFSASDLKRDAGRGQLPSHPGSRVDPVVRIRRPKPDHRTGPRPRIKVDATVGDYTRVPIDLGGIRLSLDGQDVTAQMLIRTHINRSMKTGPNRVFERLRLKYRPIQALTRGQHTVSLVVPTQSYPGTGPGITRLNWSFQVARAEDDEEDTCSEAEDDRRDDEEDE